MEGNDTYLRVLRIKTVLFDQTITFVMQLVKKIF